MKMTTETAKNIAQKSLNEEKIFYLKEQQEWINKELGKDGGLSGDQNKFIFLNNIFKNDFFLKILKLNTKLKNAKFIIFKVFTDEFFKLFRSK